MKCLYVIFSALHNVSYFHKLEFSTGSYKGILPHFPQIALKKKKKNARSSVFLLARHRAYYSTVRQLIYLFVDRSKNLVTSIKLLAVNPTEQLWSPKLPFNGLHVETDQPLNEMENTGFKADGCCRQVIFAFWKQKRENKTHGLKYHTVKRF